jgi:hypothetical protein
MPSRPSPECLGGVCEIDAIGGAEALDRPSLPYSLDRKRKGVEGTRLAVYTPPFRGLSLQLMGAQLHMTRHTPDLLAKP